MAQRQLPEDFKDFIKFLNAKSEIKKQPEDIEIWMMLKFLKKERLRKKAERRKPKDARVEEMAACPSTDGGWP
jgi:hypothetical protein